MPESGIVGEIVESIHKSDHRVFPAGAADGKGGLFVAYIENYKMFNLREYEFETTWTDETPLEGENRYYVRVEQWDGNMAWASPVWVRF